MAQRDMIDLLDETVEKINMVLNTVYDAMDENEKQLTEEAMNNVVTVKRRLQEFGELVGATENREHKRCATCDADIAGHEPRNCQILKQQKSCKFIEEM